MRRRQPSKALGRQPKAVARAKLMQQSPQKALLPLMKPSTGWKLALCAESLAWLFRPGLHRYLCWFILASMLQKSKNGIERTCAVLLDASYEELYHGSCHGLEQHSRWTPVLESEKVSLNDPSIKTRQGSRPAGNLKLPVSKQQSSPNLHKTQRCAGVRRCQYLSLHCSCFATCTAIS